MANSRASHPCFYGYNNLRPPSDGMPFALSLPGEIERLPERDWKMLRVEFEDVGDTLTMRLQGRFVGPFAKDTRDLVTHTKIPPRLVINLSEVTFVDAPGEEMLSWLARIGGRFIADNCYPLHVCQRLHLPMAPKRAGSFSRAM
jgi:hypothetical protein